MNNKFEIDELFECFIEEFGEPTSSKAVKQKTLEQYKDSLPCKLLEYWQEYGFCDFNHGLFWMVNPDDYEDILEVWLGDTKIIEQDAYYVIARSAFGELFLWGKETGYKYKINPNQAWIIEKDGDSKEIEKGDKDYALQMFFYLQQPKRMSINDLQGEPLFDQCKIMHKPLAYDEMYAFEPALFLGGEPKLENTVKVNIFAHLSMLASFGHKEILDKDGLIQKTFG